MPPLGEEDAAPPPYSSHATSAVDTPVFDGSEWSNARNVELPTATQCMTHLKLLHAFARLRREVGNTERLYGIEFEWEESGENVPDEEGTVGGKDGQPREVHATSGTTALVGRQEAGMLAERMREKRWTVFVNKAVDRFEKWWESLPSGSDVFNAALQTSHFDSTGSWESKQIKKWPKEGSGMDAYLYKHLPPLDVLMVWHAYMLNPRVYLQDCMRMAKRPQWRSSFPWQLIHESIDDSFAYDPPAESKETFAQLTPHAPWDWEHDLNDKSVSCPRCCKELLVPYTRLPASYSAEAMSIYLADDSGYANWRFYDLCSRCDLVVTHEKLRVGKFIDDVTKLRTSQLPLCGTILDARGVPELTTKGKKLGSHDPFFPNRVCQKLHRFDPQALRKDMEHLTVNSVKKEFKNVMGRRSDICYVNSEQSRSFDIARDSRIAVRKMLSHYGDNSSPFGLDLVGGVIRQASFIQKMVEIDWLHSPSLTATMHHCILKYNRFTGLIASSPNIAVPTLDVDLAWHTHQLTPKTYYKYTLAETSRFVNHDDKIPGPDLNTAFIRTAQLYEKKFGTPYAECACWYCETTREERRASLSNRILGFPLDVAHIAAMKLPTDATSGPHISTHNALVPASATQRRAELDRLARAYTRVCTRYEKKKYVPPARETDPVACGPYGYPVVLPGYVPYYSESTAVDEGSLHVGGGACVAGTCCPGASAGNCAGGGNAAGPSCAASCSGSGGGGGCGGGGGGD